MSWRERCSMLMKMDPGGTPQLDTLWNYLISVILNESEFVTQCFRTYFGTLQLLELPCLHVYYKSYII